MAKRSDDLPYLPGEKTGSTKPAVTYANISKSLHDTKGRSLSPFANFIFGVVLLAFALLAARWILLNIYPVSFADTPVLPDIQSFAVYTSELRLSYRSIVITLGFLSGLFMVWSLFLANRGRTFVLCIFYPVAFALSVILSRLLHWYCNSEQYSSLAFALRNISEGDFVFAGVVTGSLLAMILCGLIFRSHRTFSLLFDCAGPALVLLLVFVRLSSLFSGTCVSYLAIGSVIFQEFPFSVECLSASGETEYRFATFIIEAICLAVLFVVLLVFFFKNRNNASRTDRSIRGSVGSASVIGCSAIEIIMDSTRCDSSFFPFSGFLSIAQLTGIILTLTVFIVYSVRVGRKGGFKWKHAGLWAGWLFSLCGILAAQLLVQRYSEMNFYFYIGMAICLMMWVFCSLKMYSFQCDDPDRKV